jgi:hypothetical protein
VRRDAIIFAAFCALSAIGVYGLAWVYVPEAAFFPIFMTALVVHFGAGYLIGRRRALTLGAVPFVMALPFHQDYDVLPSYPELVAIFELAFGLPLVAAGIGVRGALADERRGFPGTVPPRRP